MRGLALLLVLSGAALGRDFDRGDWAWSGAAGVGGGALLGAGGVALAVLALEDDGGYDLDTFGLALVLGLPMGLTLGASTAVFAYGELSGHDGSFMAALAGSTVGTLTGFGLFALTGKINSDLVPLGAFFLVLGPAAGASLGYGLSLDAPAEPPTQGAVLDYQPTLGFRLAVPALSICPTSEGGLAVALPVVAGSF